MKKFINRLLLMLMSVVVGRIAGANELEMRYQAGIEVKRDVQVKRVERKISYRAPRIEDAIALNIYVEDKISGIKPYIPGLTGLVRKAIKIAYRDGVDSAMNIFKSYDTAIQNEIRKIIEEGLKMYEKIRSEGRP
ncbi:hypothetical protein D1T48_gp14 [Thermoproteus tenax virus 1]|uniref:Uncharacterized 15.4 kDa protein n=1 Tax=Thermoproteus tenax virus 1 (strain KRA1) TaxID=10480 RepID=YORD_TTV1K|nr:hypothetical protein D1T48_gp14 [Thermoproteus tenax virus 1]P19288.1 RecName: Full=Uncharacterized 15.4 kDa protein [Thermoproteus tenax virus 1 (STRAIN KRA1)]CAA32982.1 unnamed protein product [Thermoproteus tenax virus 1]